VSAPRGPRSVPTRRSSDLACHRVLELPLAADVPGEDGAEMNADGGADRRIGYRQLFAPETDIGEQAMRAAQGRGGVGLPRHRNSEHSQRPIADKLGERAAVDEDRPLYDGVKSAQQRENLHRRQALAEAREPREVDEEDGGIARMRDADRRLPLCDRLDDGGSEIARQVEALSLGRTAASALDQRTPDLLYGEVQDQRDAWQNDADPEAELSEGEIDEAYPPQQQEQGDRGRYGRWGEIDGSSGEHAAADNSQDVDPRGQVVATQKIAGEDVLHGG